MIKNYIGHTSFSLQLLYEIVFEAAIHRRFYHGSPKTGVREKSLVLPGPAGPTKT